METPIAAPERSADKTSAPASEPMISRVQALGVIARAKELLTHSEEAWKRIAQEKGGVREAFVPYGVCMALLGAAAGIMRGFLWSSLTSFAPYGMGMAAGAIGTAHIVTGAIVSFVGTLVFFALAGKLLELIAPSLGAKTDWAASCRVVIYASTPACAASLIGVIPFVGHLFGMAGDLWSLILLYQGFQIVLRRGARPTA